MPCLGVERLCVFFCRHGLVPTNIQERTKGPVDTYEGIVNGSTLDYIVVPAEVYGYVTECSVGEWCELNTSDHFPVSATTRIDGIARICKENMSKGRIK